jgi:hypothetical protein
MMARSRTRILLLILGSVFAALVLAGAIAHLEPFAQRYEGKTVNQWLNYRVETDVIPWQAIIAFGTNALPALIAEKDDSFWQGPARRFNDRFEISVLSNLLSRAFQKEIYARDWGQILMRKNASLEVDLLKNNPDDVFVLGVLDLKIGVERYDGSSLSPYLSDRDSVVRARARKLFKLAYQMDEKTFQKWLSDLDHPQSSGDESNKFN